MEELNLLLLSDLKEKCVVFVDDVIVLCCEVFGDGVVVWDEVEWIFDFNEVVDILIFFWLDFFVEVLFGYFLNYFG